MMIINHCTYTPDGELFARSIVPIVEPIHGDVPGAVAWKVAMGWTQTSANQVAKVDHLGFLDVITYLSLEPQCIKGVTGPTEL